MAERTFLCHCGVSKRVPVDVCIGDNSNFLNSRLQLDVVYVDSI